MDAMTVAVDLAKDVFEVAVANRAGRIFERKRLTRRQFEHFIDAAARRDDGGDGGVRHGALLGPTMPGARAVACGCCRRSMCARTCVATKPIARDTEGVARGGSLWRNTSGRGEDGRAANAASAASRADAVANRRGPRASMSCGACCANMACRLPSGARTALTRMSRDPRRMPTHRAARPLSARPSRWCSTKCGRWKRASRDHRPAARARGPRAPDRATPATGARRRACITATALVGAVRAHSRVSPRARVCELARADAAGILQRAPPHLGRHQ